MDRPEQKLMLFVSGFPGGGTDLVKTILNAHPEVHLNGEMPLLINLARTQYRENIQFSTVSEIDAFKTFLKELNAWGNITNLEHDFSVDLRRFTPISRDEVLRICFNPDTAHVWGNKTPQYTENLATLARLFPRAKFLIIVRDVRDVCLSWQNKWGKDMIWCASKWADRMARGWDAARQLPTEQSLFIKFEDLLRDTKTCMESICEFLGIEFSARVLEHHKYTHERLPGKINYGREIIADNQEKWRTALERNAIRRIEQIAFDTMQLYGYDISQAESRRTITGLEAMRGRVKDLSGMLFVGNRALETNSVRTRIEEILYELHKYFLLKLG